MQTAAFALVCLLSAGAVAWAAEPARQPPGQAAPLPQSPSPPESSDAQQPGGSREAGDRPHAPDSPRPRAETAHRSEPPRGKICFNAADTRDKIASHKLLDPFHALRSGRLQGEALRVRLCRWKTDQFVYDISVLRRDGRVVHVYMNAENGQTVGALNDNDRK